MERLFCYLIFIGCLCLIWGRQISPNSSSLSELEKEKKNNVTDSTNKNHFAMERINHGNKKEESLPFRFHGRRKYQTSKNKNEGFKNIGLSAYEEPPPRPRKRNLPPPLPPPYLNRGFNIYRYADSAKKYLVPPYSQQLFPAKHYDRKHFHNGFGRNNISAIDKNLRPPFPPKINNSSADKSGTKKINEEASEIIKIFQSYPNEGRSPRYHNHRHNSKFCSACNSVPWIPLIKVPYSYREEKSQHFDEVHKPHLNINFNSSPSVSTSGFLNSRPTSSTHSYLNSGPKNSAHDFLLPPIPALPSPQYVLDGTISSSFGLPVGNIPISHGLLAPLNHLATKFNRYGANSIDYSKSLSYYNPQNILNNNFPALSPVPIVPIYDSGQFHQEPFFNNPVTKLLPPTTKTLAVSNVFLTFSEGNQGNLNVPYQGNSGTVFGSDQRTIVDLHPPPPEHIQKPLIHTENQLQNTEAEGFEIVQSVPIAEFLASDDFVPPPPLQHIPQNFQSSSYSQNSLHHQNGDSSEQSQSSESTEDDPSNYLVPPPIDYYYNSTLNEVFPPYPPKYKENNKQGPLHASPSESKPVTSGPIPSWIFSDGQAVINPTPYPMLFESQVNINPPANSLLLEPQSSVIATPHPPMLFESHANLNPTSHPMLAESQTNINPTAHPLLSESQAIASVVNSQLYPELPKPLQITSPEAQNSGGSKGKKIQIIIPYTTKSKNDMMDPNGVESVRYEVLESPSIKLTRQTNITDNLTFTTSNPLITESFSSKNINSTRQETFAHSMTPDYKTIKTKGGNEERNDNDTYYSETQHIIASNVRQLLLNEVEKIKPNQNFPLQRNIDNWTALEYSNHKVYENKQPEKIITQALAVTTIPGTSISHLLLPSKKIPSEYFATTASPIYEDTPNFVYEIVNSTVNSSPFTARPYATTNFYSPLTSITKETSDYHEPNENQRSTTLSYNNNYTVVGKSRVSTWNKLNENLVPTARTSGRRIEETTLPVFTNRVSRGPTKGEKVEVVTPVYWTNTKNFTENPFRRTTRHLTTTVRSTSTEDQKTQTHRPKIFPFKSRLRTTLLKSVNSTKLEKVSKGKNFNETSSNNITRLEGSKQGNSENLNKTVIVHGSLSSFKVSPVVASTLLRNISSEEVIKLLKTNKSEEFSINDIFPFRNQELPWESNGLNSSNLSSQNERQRKSLIKQTILGKSKTAT